MKTKLYKLTALLLCFLMVFAVAGCGNKATTSEPEETQGTFVDFEDETVSVDNTTETNSKGGTASTTSGNGTTVNTNSGTVVEKPVEMNGSDPFANIPKRLRGTTVTFAHFGDEGADEYAKLFKAFEKKTGIKVKPVSFNQGEYVSLVAKQINGGNAPDVIICNDEFPTALEIAQPIQNIVDLNDDFWDDDITNITTVGNNTYFVNSLEGVWQNVGMIFYNKKIFSDSGVTSPAAYWKNGTWTYENFVKCLSDVTALGKIGGQIDQDALATQMGSPIIGYDTAKKTFVNGLSGAESAYTLYADSLKKGYWTSTAYWGTFASGNIGLMSSGNYGLKYNGYFKDMDAASIGVVPIPTTYKGQQLKVSTSLRGYGVAKGAKNPEAAAYFIRYFLDYKYYEEAGVNCWMNKTLEKAYFDEILPDIKKRGRVFNFTTRGLTLIGQADAFSEVKNADPAAVPGLLSSKNNIVVNAINKLNEKLK